MFVNFGKAIPTRNKHDLSGMHLWDDGQGIFICKKDMKSDMITIQIGGPEKNILVLKNTLKKS